MKLFGRIEKVEPLDDGTVKVHGIASTEARDDQGEVVLAEAMRAAIPDYLKWPCLREMHQLSAAGKTIEADVGDDKITRIVAHVIDPIAVKKVKSEVYRGFSIGGNVTQRKPGDSKTITGLTLTEISLVDRPANPEAIFDVWKSTMMQPAEPFNSPIQIWACGVLDHRHIAKADAMKCLESRSVESAATSKSANAPESAAASVVEKSGEALDSKPEFTEGSHDFVEGVTAEDLAAKVAAELEAIEKGKPAEGGKEDPNEEGEQDEGKPGDSDGKPKSEEKKVLPTPAPKDAPNALMPKPGDPEDKQTAADAPGDGSKPYGDVKYADPGYQSDGKKRYPIDTEAHVRAAWSYINKPANSKKYSSDQLSGIKGRIKAAGKKFGIEFDDGKALQASMTKALWDAGQVACIIMDLDGLAERLVQESAIEGDDSPQPERLHAIIKELCDFLTALVAEETAEVIEGNEIDGPVEPYLGAGMEIARARGIAGLNKAAERGVKGAAIMADLLKGARHSAANQAKLNLAAHCVGKAMMDGKPTDGEGVHLGECHKALLDAGAMDHQSVSNNDDPSPSGGDDHATQHSGHNTSEAPQGMGPASPSAGGDKLTASNPAAIMLDMMLKAAGATHGMHLACAHKCMQDVSGGQTCKAMMDGMMDGKGALVDMAKAAELPGIVEAAKLAKMSGADMAHLHKAHFHLTSVPGSMKCDAAGGATQMMDEPMPKAADPNVVENPVLKADEPNDLVKAIAALLAKAMPQKVDAVATKTVQDDTKPNATKAAVVDQTEALTKALGPLTAQLAEIAKQGAETAARVDAIARTPLPAQTISSEAALPAGLIEVSKAQDGRLRSDQVNPSQLTPEQIALAMSKMSNDEKTLLLIKSSYGNPLTPIRQGGVNGTIVP